MKITTLRELTVRLAAACVPCALLTVLVAYSPAPAMAQELSPCAQRTLQSLRDSSEARDLDESLTVAATLNRQVQEYIKRLDGKSTAELEADLGVLNSAMADAPRHDTKEDGKDRLSRGRLTMLRDYVAGLETWKLSGELVGKPTLSANWLKEVEAMERRRTELTREISILEEENESAGCGSQNASAPPIAGGATGTAQAPWTGTWTMNGTGITFQIQGDSGSLTASYSGTANGTMNSGGRWLGCAVQGNVADCDLNVEYDDADKSGYVSGKVHAELACNTITITTTIIGNPSWQLKHGPLDYIPTIHDGAVFNQTLQRSGGNASC